MLKKITKRAVSNSFGDFFSDRDSPKKAVQTRFQVERISVPSKPVPTLVTAVSTFNPIRDSITIMIISLFFK